MKRYFFYNVISITILLMILSSIEMYSDLNYNSDPIGNIFQASYSQATPCKDGTLVDEIPYTTSLTKLIKGNYEVTLLDPTIEFSSKFRICLNESPSYIYFQWVDGNLLTGHIVFEREKLKNKDVDIGLPEPKYPRPFSYTDDGSKGIRASNIFDKALSEMELDKDLDGIYSSIDTTTAPSQVFSMGSKSGDKFGKINSVGTEKYLKITNLFDGKGIRAAHIDKSKPEVKLDICGETISLKDSSQIVVSPGEIIDIKCGSVIIKASFSDLKNKQHTITGPGGVTFEYDLTKGSTVTFNNPPTKSTIQDGTITIKYDDNDITLKYKGDPEYNFGPITKTFLEQEVAKAKAERAEKEKNEPPTIQIQTIPPIKENTNKTITAVAKDKDTAQDKLKLKWQLGPRNVNPQLIQSKSQPATSALIIAPEIMPPSGFADIEVTASDGVNKVTEKQTITILNVNKPPIISISKVMPVLENKSLALDATSTRDPDIYQPLTFFWKQITKTPKAVIENNQTSRATLIAPNVQNDTNIQLQLTVSDGNKIKGMANRTLIIPVKQVNLPPVANAGKNFVANESSIVTLNGNKTKDPDKLDKLKYLWTQVAGELFIDIKNEKTVKPSFKVPFVKQNNSLYTFKLTVTDPKGLNSSDTVNMTVRKISNITVNPPNAQVLQNLTVQEGTNATLSAANSTDPDVNETITFQWKQIGGQPQVDLKDANKATAKFIAPVVDQNTTLTFNVTATNKKGLNDTATTSVKIANIAEQGFPVIYAIIGGVGAAGAAAAFVIYKFFMGRPSGPGRAI